MARRGASALADRAASERFYRTAFAPLGIEPTQTARSCSSWDDFSLSPAG